MPRVLLVEDEEPLRRILTRNLVRRGYDVTEAVSADDAVAALRAGTQFDALALDMNLPDHSGWDVLRATRGCHVPPVIVLTALRPTQQRLDEFRPAAVLLKPFPMDALIRLVERIVRSQSEPGEASSEASEAATASADDEQ